MVVGFIDRTNHTLDVASYVLSHDRITEALLRAHARDVRIRVVVDPVQAQGSGSDDERLLAAGVEVHRVALASHGLMHHKFAIADRGQWGSFAVVTGSMNWSMAADQRNAENFVIVRLSSVVETFQAEFESLWALPTV